MHISFSLRNRTFSEDWIAAKIYETALSVAVTVRQRRLLSSAASLQQAPAFHSAVSTGVFLKMASHSYVVISWLHLSADSGVLQKLRTATGPGSDDVHVGGPGTPPMADLGRYERDWQASLLRLPDLPGRPIRQSGGGFCTTVPCWTEADGGVSTHPVWSGPLLSPLSRRLQPLCMYARRRGGPLAASTSAPARPQQQPSKMRSLSPTLPSPWSGRAS